MQWIEIKAQLDQNATETTMDLVADAFRSTGITGVVVEDPFLDPPDGWGTDAVAKPTAMAVCGYFADNPQGHGQIEKLTNLLKELENALGLRILLLRRMLKESDWASAWKAYFDVQHITPRLVIKPSWRDFEPAPGQLVIELDPGMAFGTGTHATTAQCLEMLEIYLRPGDNMLDIGTGSGVLMVGAHKLGAARVTGIDSDAVAIEVAGTNLARNQVPDQDIRLICDNLLNDIRDSFEIVVANILTEVILVLIEDLFRVCRSGTVFITTGIIDSHAQEVLDKLGRYGFEILRHQSRDTWTCIVARYQGLPSQTTETNHRNKQIDRPNENN